MRTFFNILITFAWTFLFGVDVYYLHLQVIHRYYGMAIWFSILTGYILVGKFREAWTTEKQ